MAVLAFDGVVLADLSTPCEVLGRVRMRDGRAAYDVKVCSLTPDVATRDVALRVPWRLTAVRRADTIIVPGLDSIDRDVPPRIRAELRRAVDRGARVVSICTGAFVLAASGILDGLRATTHWMVASELARRYPRIDVDPDVLYVDNGQVLTSAGAATGLDLSLYLVRRDFGAEVAAQTARSVVMPLERAGGQAQFIVHEPPARGEGAPMAALLEWMERHLHEDLSLSVIASRAGMSSRSLSRHFKMRVGASPAGWVTHARVRRAQRLLESTDQSVEQVAGSVGLGSATVLREHFARIVGTSPSAYRHAFRQP